MGASSETTPEDRLLFASLHGRACFHVVHRTPLDEAAADLRELATVAPPRRPRAPAPARVLRVDVLSRAAGHHRGAFEADPVAGWIGQRACELLMAAGGTNAEIARATANELLARSR